MIGMFYFNNTSVPMLIQNWNFKRNLLVNSHRDTNIGNQQRLSWLEYFIHVPVICYWSSYIGISYVNLPVIFLWISYIGFRKLCLDIPRFE